MLTPSRDFFLFFFAFIIQSEAKDLGNINVCINSIASVNMICVAKGDLAMKNGSFMKYDANTLTDEQKANVAGIVFWTTADMNTAADAQTPAKLTDDEIMAKDFPNCTHGLIVSLKDVNQSTMWQITSSDIAFWQNRNATYAPNSTDYKSIVSGTGAADLINYILGYQNTKILKAYNASLASSSKETVLPISLLVDFSEQNPAPANTTGWFIPSEKELTLLCGVDSDNVYEYQFGGTTKTALNQILSSLDSYANVLANNDYWSSLERANEDESMFTVLFDYNRVSSKQKRTKGYVRAVCAY